MRLVVINHLTLDGVMQGPGRPDEDTRGGFRHGGWATAAGDEVMGRALGARMGRSDGGLLLGRYSYEGIRLVESTVTTTGVIIATYQPA